MAWDEDRWCIAQAMHRAFWICCSPLKAVNEKICELAKEDFITVSLPKLGDAALDCLFLKPHHSYFIIVRYN